eukprot:760228-Hanusia_phi.AAC.4
MSVQVGGNMKCGARRFHRGVQFAGVQKVDNGRKMHGRMEANVWEEGGGRGNDRIEGVGRRVQGEEEGSFLGEGGRLGRRMREQDDDSRKHEGVASPHGGQSDSVNPLFRHVPI